MKHSDFKIGSHFKTMDAGLWRCTDVGTRIITAIKVDDHEDQSWFNGPPYAVNERVFDECCFDECNPVEPCSSYCDHKLESGPIHSTYRLGPTVFEADIQGDTCVSCHEELINLAEMQAFEKAIALQIAIGFSPWPEGFRFIRKVVSFSNSDFANLVGISQKELAGIEGGEDPCNRLLWTTLCSLVLEHLGYCVETRLTDARLQAFSMDIPNRTNIDVNDLLSHFREKW